MTDTTRSKQHLFVWAHSISMTFPSKFPQKRFCLVYLASYFSNSTTLSSVARRRVGTLVRFRIFRFPGITSSVPYAAYRCSTAVAIINETIVPSAPHASYPIWRTNPRWRIQMLRNLPVDSKTRSFGLLELRTVVD